MLKIFADWLVYGVIKIPAQTLFASALNFFIYDTIKIFLLLAVIIFIVSFVRTFFPPEKTKEILSRQNKYLGNVFAALLGVVTPFCSCSAVPLFLGFVEAGIPLGVTFSFLVSSPMINEVALVMLWGMFGWRIAIIYVISGLIIAVVSGVTIGKLKVEHLLENLASPKKSGLAQEMFQFSLKDRIKFAREYTGQIIKQIWPYVILGIGIGAWMHGYIPADFLARYAGRGNLFAVPLATLIGIPLYSSAAGVMPLVGVLTEKGVGMGTALAFMMAVTGLSLPEFMILRKVMKIRLILIFAATVGLGIIFTGYLFNLVIH